MHQQQQAANSNANKREIALRTQLRPTIEEDRVNISCENNKNHFIAEFRPARSSTDGCTTFAIQTFAIEPYATFAIGHLLYATFAIRDIF